MRIIDPHIHTHAKGVSLVDKILKAAERNGVEKLCFSSLGRIWDSEPSLEVCIQANRDVKEVMDENPNKVAGLCYINPTLGEEGLKELERCIEEYKMCGLKLWAAIRFNDPCVNPFVEKAIEYGVPILHCTWLMVTERNPPNTSTPHDIADMALKYPDATIIMAHIGGDWEIGTQAVKNCKNVLVDTSGSILEAGMVEYAVKSLGAERVVYGSDNFDMAGQITKVLSAEITDGERELIFSENIERVMRL